MRSKAEPVEAVDAGLLRLVDDMIETMYQAEGVGLAANQIGELKRLVVVDVTRPEGRPSPMALINPRITAMEGELMEPEGCLSVPNYTAPVRRALKVQVEGYDRNGKGLVIEAEGLLARCIQHELDHLDGICFVDRLNPVKRALFRKRWAKIRPPEEQ